MRFGKRPRATRFFGRKTAEPPAQTATPESVAYEPVQHDEWNDLVTPDDNQEEWRGDGLESAPFAVDEVGESDSMSAESGREATLDPTNRLLTALGRFHREVLKAREGSAHGQWPDVCMNQLISAVEIALGQDWTEVVEALGETGRVLQSYAEAGRAQDSVSFLEDAYELLCLMVGDLIVGAVRPGVVQKWKERYTRAIEDLEAAGLALVDDDESAGFAAAQEEAAPEAPFDALPALDTLAPLEDEVSVDDPGDETLAEEPAPRAVDSLLDTVSEALALIEIDPSGGHAAAFGTITGAVEALEHEARVNGRLSAAFASNVMQRLCESAQQVAGAVDDRFFELAYAFPGLYAEANDAPGDDSVDNWTMECETLLQSWSEVTEPDTQAAPSPEPVSDADAAAAQEDPFDTAALDELVKQAQEAAAAEPMSELPDLGADIEAFEPEPASAGIPEADYGAMEVNPEAQANSNDEAEAMRRALGDIINTEADTALDEAAESMPLIDEVIDTPMQILKVAEQAVSEGRAQNAKLLLLQAAASIAESEAAEAHRALEAATRRIQEEAEAVEAAMAAVSTAEAKVAEAEAAVIAGGEEAEARRAQVGEQNERVVEVEARIEAIDEEIRALQARREEEAAHLERTREDLAAVEAEAAALEADIAQRQEAEASTRQELEEARAQVKHHQRRRQEFESTLDRANDEVRQRSESLAELQQTMNRFIQPGAADEHGSGDLFEQDSTETTE